MVECTCAQCGAAFMRYPSETLRKYCSRPCFRLGRRMTTERQCPTCAKSYRPRPGREEGFCSRACIRREITRLESRRCKWCAAEFLEYPSQTRSYCTKECADRRREFTRSCGGVHYVTIRYFSCEGCEKLVVAPTWAPGRRFCTRGCAIASRPSRLMTAACAVCGEPFSFYSARSDAKYCGRACMGEASRKERQARACEFCGDTFEFLDNGSSGPGRFCSLACRDASMRTGATVQCEICGAGFYAPPSREAARFCSPQCHGDAKRKFPPGESRRQAARRRRAAKLAAEVERYSTQEIAERDGWRCQICKRPVPRSAAHPNPRSASIDHIVPLSEGGGDVKANVQLAHLKCNLSKGARSLPRGEQLRLIG